MAKTILTLILVISVAFIHAQNEASDRLRLFRSRLRVRPEDRARYGFKISCQFKRACGLGEFNRGIVIF